MSQKRDYDSTVARIAGNILSGYQPAMQTPELSEWQATVMAGRAVLLARKVVEATKATEHESQKAPA